MLSLANPLPFANLSADTRQWLLNRIAVRVSADTDRDPCLTEAGALALVRQEIPRQLAYERQFHRDEPLLPLPDGWEIRTCRCWAVVYADDVTLTVLCPLTLEKHKCNGILMGLTAEEQATRHRAEQRAQADGRAALAATRQPRRIGVGRASS